MLHVQHLGKSYGAATILSDVSFVLNDGERVGLIGPNGTGKSTLLRCLVGQEQPDRGTVVLSPVGARIGYLAQAFAEGDSRTVGEVVADVEADLRAAEAALARAAAALADATDLPTALAAYDAALARFETLGGYSRQGRAESVLHGLGLAAVEDATPVRGLSGGQKTRLGLALLLLSEPDLLLLDEPTNHLDVDALEWLEAFLDAYPGSVLLVSHDRTFLDRTVSRILYLDPATRGVQAYSGGYTEFAAAREHEREIQAHTWRRQQDYIGKVVQDVGRMKSEARSIEQSTTARQPGLRKLARKKAAVAKSRERKLERYLASDERVERPKLHWPINLDFGVPPPGGRALLRLEDVSFGYPGAAALFEHVDLEVRYGQRVAIVGPNGSGKTSLLRLMAGQLQPDHGAVQLGAGVRPGFMAQEHDGLDPEVTVLDTVLQQRPMSEHDARSFLPYFLFYGDSVLKQVKACSLGERTRLELAALVLRGCNLLLLDEPTNHLDVESRQHFEAALDAYQGSVIVVAHDRAFLRAFARRIVELRDGRVTAMHAGA
jgi:ATP-binding cassette, subfamily F, member 3